MKKSINIFSVAIDASEKKDILEKIEIMLCGNTPNKIFTPNTQMLLKCRCSAELASLLNSAELSLPDGTGIMIASRILGYPLSERMSGIDTAEEILAIAARRGLSVFLLGGAPRVAEAAAERLISSHPFLDICGTHHGYFEKNGAENREVIKKIKRASPDILFVCFGFPLQERWICENISSLPDVKLAMGLGGSLDVWSGNKKRAPKVIQRFGFEWLWRTALEPKRLKIFLEIPEFLYFALKER